MPRGTRDQESHNYGRGACKDERGDAPTANGRGLIGEAGADARQERRGNLDGRGGVKASIDRGKERLFIGKGGPANGAGGEVRAQFALWCSAGGGGFD